MRVDVAADLRESAAAFQGKVWPLIAGSLGGGELVPVESVTAAGFVKKLDIYGGIDAWQVIAAAGLMRGIASRVQFGERRWDTFTIRFSRASGAATEYAKRLRCVTEEGGAWLAPAITAQAYISRETGKVLSAAWVYSRDLYGHLAAQDLRPKIKVNPDGNEFLVVPWDELRAAGIFTEVVIPQQAAPQLVSVP